jgi:hypothetical protein
MAADNQGRLTLARSVAPGDNRRRIADPCAGMRPLGRFPRVFDPSRPVGDSFPSVVTALPIPQSNRA